MKTPDLIQSKYCFFFRLSFWRVKLSALCAILVYDSLVIVAKRPLALFSLYHTHQDAN